MTTPHDTMPGYERAHTTHNRVRAGLVVAAALLALAGCDAADADPDASADATSALEVPPDANPRGCMPPSPGHRPQTIQDVIEHLDALPRPITVPCFLESLERPLQVQATWNTFSAQPALSPADPRLFVFVDDLTISVVTSGEGRPLVEMSEVTTPGRSIKAELRFPIDGELDGGSPYRDIGDASGTECGFCHLGVSRVPEITEAFAFESEYIAGEPNKRVDLDYLRRIFTSCDRAAEPDRCHMFDAVFAHGDVVDGEFH